MSFRCFGVAYAPTPLIITYRVIHTVIEPLTDEADDADNHRSQGLNEATNPVPDLRPVTEDGADGTNLFIGKYAFTIPLLGHVASFLRSPYGWVTALVDTTVLFAIWFILKHDLFEDRDQTGSASDID